jgi:tryptophan synthase alpha chain
MNRYERSFADLKARGEIAFIPFAVAGDPGGAASESVFKTYLDAGADILEIGYPFSDPIADGPINQRAAQRAIAAGLDHGNFFKLIATLRRYSDVPMGVLMYANSALHLGYETFCKRAADAGIDSILVADMPPEEAGAMLEAQRANGLLSVFIVSELTPLPRIRSICNAVTGFVYVVSRLGTTGVQTDMDTSVKSTLKRIGGLTEKPLCVGFGISSPRHVSEMKRANAHGAIVGSALVNIIENNLLHKKTMLSLLAKSVRDFKRATR